MISSAIRSGPICVGADPISPNFGFLSLRAPLLHDLARQAERYCLQDPPTALVKLRAYAEALCELLGGHFGCGFAEEADLIEMIRVLTRSP